MTVQAVRESTDAETDAVMLADIRAWRANRHPASGDQVTLGLEEVDMLLRIAAERDELRREACAEPVTPGTAPSGMTPNMSAQYVIRECATCRHDPHGYLLPCNRQTCGCRDGRPKP